MSLCNKCVYGLCIQQEVTEILYLPNVTEVRPEGAEEWEEVEMEKVTDMEKPPIGHELKSEGTISLCYYSNDGTPPKDPIWEGQDVKKCSRFSQRIDISEV